MEPVEFEQQNTVYAKDQPEFLPLPAYVNAEETISCWKLTPDEIKKISETGILWLRQVNFGRPLQAQAPTVDTPWPTTEELKGQGQ